MSTAFFFNSQILKTLRKANYQFKRAQLLLNTFDFKLWGLLIS